MFLSWYFLSGRFNTHASVASIIGFFFLILGILFYALSLLWDIRVLGALSLLMVLPAITCIVYGIQTVKALFFPLGFLVFMIPLPFIPDLAYRLQEISIHSSTWLLDMLTLPITSSGSDIYLRDATFTIGLPCSGINTLVALLALAAVYVYILKGSFYKRIGIVILAFPIAIVANILRITTIILVAYYINIEPATGWYHDLSSLIFFIIAFLALVFVGWVTGLRLNYQLIRKNQ